MLVDILAQNGHNLENRVHGQTEGLISKLKRNGLLSQQGI